MTRYRIAVLLSVLIHLIIFAVYFRKPSRVDLPQFVKNLQIDIINLKHSHYEQTAIVPSLSFSSLVPRSDPSAGSRLASETSTAATFDVSQKMDIQSENALYPFFHALWKNIDSALGFPPDFVRARIAGTVRLQFEVNERGKFTGQIMSVESDSNYLKAYVLAILVHATKRELSHELWHSRGKLFLVAEFDFSIFTVGHHNERQSPEHMKNVLVFKRSARAEPMLNEFIDDVFKKYLPPIFPIPGGFYIDFYRAYQMVDTIRAPDENRRMHDRILLNVEEWERVVKSSRK